MKYFIYSIMLLLLATSVLGAERGLHSPVIDEAGVLTSAQLETLSGLLLETYNSGVAEHAVLILQTSNGEDLALLATELGNDQLGSTETDNGLLTIIAVDEREYFTAVGYGLEGDLNDAKIGRMQREYLVPYLADDDYYTGLEQFIITVQAELDITEAQPTTTSTSESNWIYELIPFIIFGIIVLIHASNRKKGGRRNDGDAFVAAYVASSFFRGRGGMGGGGGFGGFGGGGFGGGGAGGGF